MITKAALLLFRKQGSHQELLFVWPHGKPYLVFPGGKQEPGESVTQALHRELLEELGVALTGVKQLGSVTGATPDGRPLEMHLYGAELIGIPHPRAEIKELAWLSKPAALKRKNEMTPITLSEVFPFLGAHKLW